jgi:hypothetical protein
LQSARVWTVMGKSMHYGGLNWSMAMIKIVAIQDRL